MAGDDGPDFQTDIANIPSAALTTVGFAQGLLRAVSTDNVNPLAVIQVQAIGSCFQSNGPWAAKLPDLLARASSARLERLSAWIGWAKGDTPAFMSQTAGGRTASLLCVALGSLYSKDRCGQILSDLSSDILPQEKQTSGLFQLAEVCMCLENKLGCLGFGNHLALHLTRLRQCFFEADMDIPCDLVDRPTGEVMHAFLLGVRDVLRDDNLILSYTGTKSAGPLLALLLAMCPEDVHVQVNGEVIAHGRRDSIMFSIVPTENDSAFFHVESKLPVHGDDFRRTYIEVNGRHELDQQLRFSWEGMLSSQLDIALARLGTAPNEPLKQALANLVASTTMSLGGREWRGMYYATQPDELPAEEFRTLLGPAYRRVIQERLEKVLCRPSDILQAPALEYKMLHDIAHGSTSLVRCTCRVCSALDPWDTSSHPKGNTSRYRAWQSCPVACLWRTMSGIIQLATYSVLIHASSTCAPRSAPPNSMFGGAIYRKVIMQENDGYRLLTTSIHNDIMDLVGRTVYQDYRDSDQEIPPSICSSMEGLTIYPTTLESPSIVNPWAIQYNLIDGMLYYGSDCYTSIICASTNRGAAKQMTRKRTKVPILPKRQPILPSSIGEHSSLTMTLRPALVSGSRALLLRCLIGQSTVATEVNFLSIHSYSISQL